MFAVSARDSSSAGVLALLNATWDTLGFFTAERAEIGLGRGDDCAADDAAAVVVGFFAGVEIELRFAPVGVRRPEDADTGGFLDGVFEDMRKSGTLWMGAI